MRSLIRTPSYHLPESVQKHIDYIKPGIQLNSPKRRYKEKRNLARHHEEYHSISRLAKTKDTTLKAAPGHADVTPPGLVNASSLDTCDKLTTIACIRALYSIPKPSKAAPGNTLGIYEEYDYYTQQDLDSWFTYFNPNIPNGTHPILASINGGEAPATSLDQAGSESPLDLTIAYSLIYPQQITLYQNDDNKTTNFTDFFGTFLDAVDGSYCTYSAFGETGDDPNVNPVYPDHLPGGYDAPRQCGTHSLTNVLSVSYAGPDHELPLKYRLRQCTE